MKFLTISFFLNELISDNFKSDVLIKGHPKYTLFIGRLSFDTTEATLEREFGRYGKIYHLRLVRDIITGASRGYAFIEYKHSSDCKQAYQVPTTLDCTIVLYFISTKNFQQSMHKATIDSRQIIVDIERERLMPGWVPRRLGGGLGGRKESGQLRFGGRDRPHRRPLPKG